MATISTDTYLDGGTARTAGEAWTINGATLTIRTDSRVHANAPASMTGALGTVTMSTTLGGKLKIDGTKVRWMAFDTGSGTVPAIGTTISQGGVSGYLLGVWPDYLSAPTTPGAAMPATGYLKFREVTGGAFSAGSLTGISANASSPDVTGWIEVVGETASAFGACGLVLGSLGEFEATGDWFYLGTTNGSVGQTISYPCNGGGSTSSNIYAVQVETAPGSGIYEWYPAMSTKYTSSNLNSDTISKYVRDTGSTIIFGTDGTNNAGYVPASGCKIRMPNILLRLCTSAARATNNQQADTSASSTGYRITNDGALKINVSKVMNNWFTYTANNINTFIASDSNFHCNNYALTVNNILSELTLTNVLISQFGNAANRSPIYVNNSKNITFNNVRVSLCHTDFASANPFVISKCDNVVLNDCKFTLIKTNTDPKTVFQIEGSTNVTVSNLKVWGESFDVTNCMNITINGYDGIWNHKAEISSAVGQRYMCYLTNNANLVLDGMTIGNNNEIPNRHAYFGLIQLVGTAGYNAIRNIGSRDNFISSGTNATYYMACAIQVEAGVKNTKIQKIYVSKTRTNSLIFASSAGIANNTFESIFTDAAKSLQVQGKDSTFRAIGGAVNTSAQPHFGCHWTDYFTSDTQGAMTWFGMAPSALTSGENFVYSPSGSSKFVPASAQVLLSAVGDYFYSEMTTFIKGHTSFRNSAPTITGTNTNLVTYEYQIDTGSGWNGTWKTLNAANLSAETISPTTGFKFKLRGTKASAGVAQITSIQILSNSTVADQTGTLYPLDTATLSFTGLQPGSEVRCFVGTDQNTAVEIGGTESTGGSTFTLQHSVAGQQGYIAIINLGYETIYFDYTYKSSDDSILIQQYTDRNYNNP